MDALHRLSEGLEQDVAQLLELARTADDAWDAALASLGVEPLSPEERQQHTTGGAPLIELRLALEAVAERARAALRRAPMDAWSSPTWQALEARLLTLVDDGAQRHLAATAKPRVTTASIFANARATTPRQRATASAVGQLRCTTCGAPRLGRHDEVEPCHYCGGQLTRGGRTT